MLRSDSCAKYREIFHIVTSVEPEAAYVCSRFHKTYSQDLHFDIYTFPVGEKLKSCATGLRNAYPRFFNSPEGQLGFLVGSDGIYMRKSHFGGTYEPHAEPAVQSK